MNTINTRSNKDNVASATFLAVSLLFVAGGLFASHNAEASAKATAKAVQKMETITVTAPRIKRTTLETIVVMAPRSTSQA